MKRSELPEKLFQDMKSVEPYPAMVVPVKEMIQMTGFFPGGLGLWLEKTSEKWPEILVIGQDFSTEEKYIEMQEGKTCDLETMTWRNLIRLFQEAGVEMEACYFSNAFMGLRQTKSMTGKFPGFKDSAFVERNQRFLEHQIVTIRPKTIVTLGKFAGELLSKLSDDLIDWHDNNALKVKDKGVIFGVRISDHVCTCVALEHPSMRFSNVKRREYKGQIGNNAEIEMIKSALTEIKGGASCIV